MNFCNMKDILVIEPFCGGSHEQLVRLLSSDVDIGPRCELCCLPAKKWHWRARTSSLYLSQVIPKSELFRVLFTSSVLNLAELLALRPDLSGLTKILYFHENQLVYPVRKQQERDFQYGYNQILSCLVADVVVFNSAFNMESFLSSISTFLKLIPDHRPKNIAQLIRPKCKVLYFPMKLNLDKISELEPQAKNETLACDPASSCQPDNDTPRPDSFLSKRFSCKQDCGSSNECLDVVNDSDSKKEKQLVVCPVTEDERSKRDTDRHQVLDSSNGIRKSAIDCNFLKWDPSIKSVKNGSAYLHIVWPHRWEHDKDPESFFSALHQLQEEGLNFCVSVIGETYTQVPEIFSKARVQLGERVVAWGYQTREDYWAVLDNAHVVVSTALHEFFGVSMLEAVSRKCYPLCPNRLVYPEIYPKECLYSTQAQLVKKLRRFCIKPQYVDSSICEDLVKKFTWDALKDYYKKLIVP